MALDLAYLVLERCPLRGRLFHALFIIALDADGCDHARISVVKLARWARTSKRHAQEIYDELQAEGWLLHSPARDTTARRLVIRRRLLMLPPIPQVDGRARTEIKFAGTPRRTLDQHIIERARQSAEDIREFHGLTAGAHLSRKPQ
jgi:hypothetical protein